MPEYATMALRGPLATASPYGGCRIYKAQNGYFIETVEQKPVPQGLEPLDLGTMLAALRQRGAGEEARVAVHSMRAVVGLDRLCELVHEALRTPTVLGSGTASYDLPHSSCKVQVDITGVEGGYGVRVRSRGAAEAKDDDSEPPAYQEKEDKVAAALAGLAATAGGQTVHETVWVFATAAEVVTFLRATL